MEMQSLCTGNERTSFVSDKRKRSCSNGGQYLTTMKMMPILLLVCVMLVHATDARPGNIQRRGFKSSLLSTARGFGKRGGSLFSKGIIPTTAINFGKRSAPPGLNIRAAMYAKDHPSLPDESGYGLDVSNLLHELNKRASQNPHMIPLLLNMIHENDDSPMST